MLRIVAVSYINTWPFIYGINYSGFLKDYTLELAVPSNCAKLFQHNNADIALVPVGALPYLSNYKLIENYGIASYGPVKSVILVSNSPIEEIETVFIDTDSLSSAKLVEILSKKYWNKKLTIVPKNYDAKNYININEALMLIGDKALFLEKSYKYIFDLAQIWKEFCNLPFVFAVWISKMDIEHAEQNLFIKTLEFGISNIPQALDKYNVQNKNKSYLLDYLTNNIILKYDNKAKEGMNLYVSLLNELD